MNDEETLREASLEAGYVIDDLGLLADGELDDQTWRRIGEELGRRSTGLNWALGDWLLKGDTKSTPLGRYGSQGAAIYDEAERLTGLSRGFLIRVRSTAAAWPRDWRSRGASWTAHRVIGEGWPREVWLAMLVRTISERLSVTQLEELAAAQRAGLPEPARVPKSRTPANKRPPVTPAPGCRQCDAYGPLKEAVERAVTDLLEMDKQYPHCRNSERARGIGRRLAQSIGRRWDVVD